MNYAEIDTGIPIKEFTLDSIKFSHFVNTRYLCEAALAYEANEKKYGVGVYTDALVGTREWQEFWDEEERRCRYGFQVGDLYITGRQYFYLNYFRIMRSPRKEERDKNKIAAITNKVEAFPSFWGIQWLWFTFKHIANYKGTFLGIESKGGLDICAAKTRGAGYSFMDACDDVYNFIFIPQSNSYVFAYSSEYLAGDDGIMWKIQTALDFINVGTRCFQQNKQLEPIGYWGRNRYDTGNEPSSFRSGYKDLQGNIHGFRSLISGVICDKPRKARGKRGMKITLEEGGSFPNLLDIEATSRALVHDGGLKTGQRCLFGTGGEDGPGIVGLETIFNDPKAFGFMGFPNIWEGEMDEVGFFCPSFLADAKYIDGDGNSDIQGHIKEQTALREEKRKVSPAIYDKHVAELPFVPSESLKRLKSNVFPIVEVNNQLRRIQTMKKLETVHGDLQYDVSGRVKFAPNPDAKPINKYPHNKLEVKGKILDLTGCVTIFEKPFRIGEDVPDDMYFIVVDNYGVDEAVDTTSLYAAYVFKYYDTRDITNNKLPVAWYVGRPNLQKDAHEVLLKLSLFYGNAKIMSEHNASGQQIINFMRQKQKMHLLMSELDAATNKKEAKKRKSIFMTVSRDFKVEATRAFAEYLMEDRREEIDSDTYQPTGKMIKNIHEIWDEGLLEEMLRFDLNKGNFDRISACILAPIIFQDRANKNIGDHEQSHILATIELFSHFHEEDEYNNEYVSEY